MDFKEIYNSQKDRVLTGFSMLAFGILIAFVDNLFVTWSVLGVVYLFAFYEAMKLFKVEDNKLYVYAVFIWLIALFFQIQMI